MGNSIKPHIEHAEKTGACNLGSQNLTEVNNFVLSVFLFTIWIEILVAKIRLCFWVFTQDQSDLDFEKQFLSQGINTRPLLPVGNILCTLEIRLAYLYDRNLFYEMAWFIKKCLNPSFRSV